MSPPVSCWSSCCLSSASTSCSGCSRYVPHKWHSGFGCCSLELWSKKKQRNFPESQTHTREKRQIKKKPIPESENHTENKKNQQIKKKPNQNQRIIQKKKADKNLWITQEKGHIKIPEAENHTGKKGRLKSENPKITQEKRQIKMSPGSRRGEGLVWNLRFFLVKSFKHPDLPNLGNISIWAMFGVKWRRFYDLESFSCLISLLCCESGPVRELTLPSCTRDSFPSSGGGMSRPWGGNPRNLKVAEH